MSYDIELRTQEGELIEHFNITYNVSGMFYDYYPSSGIRVIYGKSGKKSLPSLLGFYQNMVYYREKMIDMQPENGWGNWENTVKCINKMIMKASEHPDAIWGGD